MASHIHMYPDTVLFLKPNSYESEIPEEVGKHFLATKIN